MNVFFGFSPQQIIKFQKDYQTIRETIKSLGHTLVRDRLDEIMGQSKKEEQLVPPLIQPEIISAILASDAVVLDATVKSMNIAFQLTYALEKERPVLFLAQTKQEELNKLFKQIVSDSFLTAKSYNKDNLKDIITDYFSDSENTNTKVRLNLLLEKRHINYIDWASFVNNVTKTQMFQRAIDHLIKSDKEYHKHLSRD